MNRKSLTVHYSPITNHRFKGDGMDKKLTLHLIQWRVIPGDVEKNLKKADTSIASAGPEKGDIVLLPEMFSSGFYYQDLERMAGSFEEVVRWMGEVAVRYGIGMAGSAPALKNDGISNTMVFVDSTGNLKASYDKAHLFAVAEENLHFTPGKQGGSVFRWEGIDVGLAICFDLRFPEMFRELCDRGSRLVLVSAQWPRARIDHFRDFTKVRAMENQLFLASCNSCGEDEKGLVLGGQSSVVGPMGEVRGVLGEEEGVLSVDVDLGEVERARENFPVLKERRKDLFK